MVRSSFPSAVKDYLVALSPYRTTSTTERLRRDLHIIHEDLKVAGRDKSPGAFQEADVEALLLRWRTRLTARGTPMDVTSQAHLFRALKGFLAWSGNPVIERMKASGHVRFPRTLEKPIRALSEDELARLRAAADSIDGWDGTVARFLVAFLPASALRPKEIRLARLRDLELGKGRILVAHPKGEGSWAAPDYAPVLTFARPAVEDFLRDRAAFVGGEPCEWLMPYRRPAGELGPWSEAMLRKLKGQIARRSGGVPFSLKTFRATFCQMAIDAGARVEAASRGMRHGSTRTTEKYYGRIRAENAFHEIEAAFAGPKVRVEETH